VHITTPVHKGNLAEVANIRKYFEGYGAGEPHFTQIGNRSWEEGPWSQLALAPVGRWCAPDELRTFVVDWDGAVLACCLDFSKSAKLGDLTKQSIREILGSKPWLEMFDIHRTKSWSQKEACSRCRGDLYGNTQTIVQPLLGIGNQAQHLSGHAFNVVPEVTRDAGGSICVGKKTPDGIVIFGPYRRLDPGRYRVRHFLEVIKVRTRKASIETDIVVDGARRIGIKHHPISRHGGLELDMEFESDGSITEFRVARVGVEFVHTTAQSCKRSEMHIPGWTRPVIRALLAEAEFTRMTGQLQRLGGAARWRCRTSISRRFPTTVTTRWITRWPRPARPQDFARSSQCPASDGGPYFSRTCARYCSVSPYTIACGVSVT
jgi:radical SAM protein with 4Fe4S-binding SPASM domain